MAIWNARDKVQLKNHKIMTSLALEDESIMFET